MRAGRENLPASIAHTTIDGSRERDNLYFLFNAPAPSTIYTLSLHDALPISPDAQELAQEQVLGVHRHVRLQLARERLLSHQDRKSTRLNSSHVEISYAVFCLKKKTWLR